MSILGNYAILDYTLTRNNDVTAYVALDALCDSLNACPSWVVPGPTYRGMANALLLNARCVCSNNGATLPLLQLWLFKALKTATDNAAWVPADSDILEDALAVIDFNTWSAGNDTTGDDSGNSFSQASILNPTILQGDTNNTIYGIVKVKNAYTPISGEIFHFKLDVEIPTL